MLFKCKDIDNFLNTKQKIAFCLIFLCFFAQNGWSQTSLQLEYIAKYRVLAIKESRAHGIPASITLAQGLLESGAGTSRLAREGNNHFGIKHSRTRGGDSIMIGTVCYRRYESPEQSYLDHSQFLLASRYKSLFELDITDYRGWARGLKRCGYATDPGYAEKLIAMVEMCHLQDLDKSDVQDDILAMAEPDESAKPDDKKGGKKKGRPLPDVMHNVHRKWGLHCVKVVAGDTWEQIAAEFNMKPSKLFDLNDVKEKKPSPPLPGTLVYLEKKNHAGPDGHETYTTREGDTWWTVSQAFGIRLGDLRRINDARDKDPEPQPGTPLRLHP